MYCKKASGIQRPVSWITQLGAPAAAKAEAPPIRRERELNFDVSKPYSAAPSLTSLLIACSPSDHAGSLASPRQAKNAVSRPGRRVEAQLNISVTMQNRPPGSPAESF